LVSVALQQGTIFTDVGEDVCRLGVEVKSLKSVVQACATVVAVRSGCHMLQVADSWEKKS
jgi:hypothetical protein